MLFVALILIIFFKKFVITNKIVNGNSMNNSFFNNDVLLVEKINKKISRYDVVIIKSKEIGLKKSLIKRVIALPYESIQIKDGAVWINDNKLDNDVVSEFINEGGIADKKIVLGKDEYFVLGDNRNNSEDSRSEWLGIVNLNQIDGKPIMRIYPFNKVNFVN